MRLRAVGENDTDPAAWGVNFPRQYDAYQRTALATRTRFGGHGGSEALPDEKIERDPWLKRMFLGYAFSLDYRDRRGHAYMLADQESTQRLSKTQSGSCLHCHASVMPLYNQLGNGDPHASMVATHKMTYLEAHAQLKGMGHAHPVSCADCHMPYIREGAAKISDHWVRSPLLNVNRSCQTCHHFPEQELLSRVEVIQNRNHDLLQRSAKALMDLLDSIQAAKAAGVGEEALRPALESQRSAQWRIDFIAAENSMGFHAPQEAARILGEAIDLARQGQVAARALAPPAGGR